jgi:hypothetical protein
LKIRHKALMGPIRFYGAVTEFVTPKTQCLTHCNAL